MLPVDQWDAALAVQDIPEHQSALLALHESFEATLNKVIEKPIDTCHATTLPNTTLHTPQASWPSRPLEPSSYLHWFQSCEEAMIQQQAAIYTTRLQSWTHAYQTADSLYEACQSAQSSLEQLLSFNQHVTKCTQSLQSASRSAVQKERQAVRLLQGLCDLRAPFGVLQELTTLLTKAEVQGQERVEQAITRFARDPLLVDCLMRADMALLFMQQNNHYREAEVYAMRYRHCLTRATGLLKMHVQDIFQQLRDLPFTKGEESNAVVSRATDAIPWRQAATELDAILRLLERRVITKQTDAESILIACQEAYIAARQKRLQPFLQQSVLQWQQEQLQLAPLLEQGFATITLWCDEEASLWQCFFQLDSTENDTTLNVMPLLETLTASFMDLVRPKILSMGHLETLAQICSLLSQVVVMEDDEDEPSATHSSAYFTFEEVETGDVSRDAIRHLAQRLMGDARQRLIFRLQTNIQELARGKDVPALLDYPQRLQGRFNAKNSLIVLDVKLLSENEPAYKMAYPPVRQVIEYLYLTRNHIAPEVLSELLLEMLQIVQQRLLQASTVIANKSQSDAFLFLIRHWLLLRDFIAPLSFTSDTPNNVSQNNGNPSFVGSVLLGWVQRLPGVREQPSHPLHWIDQQLRYSCQQWCTLQTQTCPMQPDFDAWQNQARGKLPVAVQQLQQYVVENAARDAILGRLEQDLMAGYTRWQQQQGSWPLPNVMAPRLKAWLTG